MFARKNLRRSLRIGAVASMLALTPLAFGAGGDLKQNDACAAKEAADKCCMEYNSVCTLEGQTHYDYYMTGSSGPCPGN